MSEQLDLSETSIFSTHPFQCPAQDYDRLVAQFPFRYILTPDNHRMSVAMTNCETFGWVSDSSGYRYDAIDPISSQILPPMPGIFYKLAKDAAAQAGFQGFVPDACLGNRYEPALIR